MWFIGVEVDKETSAPPVRNYCVIVAGKLVTCSENWAFAQES